MAKAFQTRCVEWDARMSLTGTAVTGSTGYYDNLANSDLESGAWLDR